MKRNGFLAAAVVLSSLLFGGEAEAGRTQCVKNCYWRSELFNWSDYQLRLCIRWCSYR